MGHLLSCFQKDPVSQEERLRCQTGSTTLTATEHKVDFWVSESKGCHQKLIRAAAQDWGNDIFHLIKTIKSWYGGMGSFSGLSVKEGQDHFEKLRTGLYTQVEALLRINQVDR